MQDYRPSTSSISRTFGLYILARSRPREPGALVNT
jgi:hypothetical protein